MANSYVKKSELESMNPFELLRALLYDTSRRQCYVEYCTYLLGHPEIGPRIKVALETCLVTEPDRPRSDLALFAEEIFKSDWKYKGIKNSVEATEAFLNNIINERLRIEEMSPDQLKWWRSIEQRYIWNKENKEYLAKWNHSQ